MADGSSSSGVSGLLVLMCGLPGCGKDLIGRACAQSFPRGAALSQDEHGGDATRACNAAEGLLQGGHSPVFVLRNGVDAADRLPYVDAARRNGYRVVAVWPAELSRSDEGRWAALWCAAVAGCYERLRGSGNVGHETLTVANGDRIRPAKVCLSFLRGFREPSVPGEVDASLVLPFLLPSLDGTGFNADVLAQIVPEMKKAGRVPEVVASLITGTIAETQANLFFLGEPRRPPAELIQEVLQWATAEMAEATGGRGGPGKAPGPPNKEERQRMQRLAKVRGAVEHLVSPANIAGCRPSGSTVSLCAWLPPGDGLRRPRPAWPASYFCGSPAMRKLRVGEHDVLEAAHESSAAAAPLQQGENGVLVEVLSHGGVWYVAPVDTLPDDALWKLGQPGSD